MVCEIAGVEVALETTDGEDQFSRLDFLLDIIMRDGADVDLPDIVSARRNSNVSATYASIS